ncbi:hypothetical protein EC973_000574 [Apophysomyces ossiformis]|uniref:Protein YTP1-like C-terminal domain-containing protein n=1 Tax=Apophysomyces ossiformis TaxID=679940 RepID=A0A8H7ENR3_9FUNG|nr:hypothetical protein EC973_000574 [Apophysomyces ossiformis]
MAGGVCRIIEICFVWKEGVFNIAPFQYLPPMTLIMAGVMFMGATEEQLYLLNSMNIDPSSYSNVLLAFAFAIFLFASMLIILWEKLTNYAANSAYTEVASDNIDTLHADDDFLDDDEDEEGYSDAVPLKTTRENSHIMNGNY